MNATEKESLVSPQAMYSFHALILYLKIVLVRRTMWNYIIKFRLVLEDERGNSGLILNQTSMNLLDSLETFLSTFQKDLSSVSGQISELQHRSKDIDRRLKSRQVCALPVVFKYLTDVVFRESRNLCPNLYLN